MRPYQKPHPPIAVAGSSPSSQTLEVDGELGWWLMITLRVRAPNPPALRGHRRVRHAVDAVPRLGKDRAKGLRSPELLATETLPQLSDRTPDE